MGRWTDLTEVTDLLVEPEEGSQKIKGHDRTYGEIRDGFDTVRDSCNEGIDKVNDWLSQAGRSERLPRLTEKSLDDYVVFPLSGNYYRIQQNGAACKILKDGMTAWGANFGRLAVNSLLAFEGQAQTSFAAHLGAYGVVMAGVGRVMSSGSAVFDSIAVVSEKIAIRVEKMLIEMGKKLLKLSKTVGKRFLGGWASAALLIKDLAEHGLSVITDVVDDVKWCIAAIDKCFELKDEIEAWAQTQADRLDAFKEIATMVEELPGVDLDIPFQDAEVPDFDKIEEYIETIDPDFAETDEGRAAEDAIDEAGEDLVDDSGYVHPSWAEACVTPPPGMEHLPYVEGDPSLHAPRDPITGNLLPSQPTHMTPPVPGESSKRYYEMYEDWRTSLRPPLYAPPAEGRPRRAGA
jgi:hypothetical protein